MAIRYNDEGRLKILQFTDLHFGSVPSNEADEKTYEKIEQLVKKESPDLIVYSGDIIYSMSDHGADNPRESFLKFIEFANSLGYPVALTYGNHDTEEKVSRDDLRAIADEKLTCHAEKSEIMLKNDRESYIIKIEDPNSSDESFVFVLDSYDYSPNRDLSYYAWVDHDQINWFRDVVDKYDHKNGPKTDLVFQHIPIPEYWQASENIIAGEFKEGFAENLSWLAASENMEQYETMEDFKEAAAKILEKSSNLPEYGVCSPEINSGFFNQILNSNVWGMFVGHDHDNSFDGIYKGIHLVYGQSTGYNSYGNAKGGRLITIDNNSKEVSTEILFFE